MRASGHEYYAEFDWLVSQWSFLICISLLVSCRMHFMSIGLRLSQEA
jgi:hypothetical protein